MGNGATLRLELPLPEPQVFRTQAMEDVLEYLIANPFQKFTHEQLATHTGNDDSSVSQAVDLLGEIGVLRMDEGNPHRISINTHHLERATPVSRIPQPEYRDRVRSYLETLSSEVDQHDQIERLIGVILFGTVAMGSAERGDDIDLLVIVEGDVTITRRLVSRVARDLGSSAFSGEQDYYEVLVETPESVSARKQKTREIFEQGIVLTGAEKLTDVRCTVFES